MLSTMKVIIATPDGKEVECRAVLDSGSQLNFITQSLAQKLGLKQRKETINVKGIGAGSQKADCKVNVQLKSRITGFTHHIEAHILPKIIDYQPSRFIDISKWPIPKNIPLADPHFSEPQPIDLLVGAENYFDILSIGQIKLGSHLPTLQNTLFGWIVAGKVKDQYTSTRHCGICTEPEQNLENQIQKFWEIEEKETTSSSMTLSERKCEQYFNLTQSRVEDGRFVVRLPFEKEASSLGTSKDIAAARLQAMERKFKSNPELKTQYVAFMREYINLNHMEKIDYATINKTPHYFLPHHCVLKPESTSTKLRVVFDGSAKTSTNVSLNEILHTGPKIQQDLFSVLLRFRIPKYVFTADIEKMYRQILIHPEDRRYQLIWWREHENQQMECYQLRTVTYGLTTAPYLAMKCLSRLAIDNKEKFPSGAAALNNAFYVDDIMTGSDKLQEALEIQEQVITILQSAGFKLRKWCTNHKTLLQNIPTEDQVPQLTISNDEDYAIKTLGLTWLPKIDEFRITTPHDQDKNQIKLSKRQVLADIAHLFDPLGLVSPVVVTAKIFLQELWTLKLDWDAAIPMHLHTQWLKFRKSLRSLEEIKIPRHVKGGRSTKTTQLHIFCDASKKAYGAAAYIRTEFQDGTVRVRLLCAKSKVAPLKQTTIPRLELCAAKIAASLLQRIQIDLNWTEPSFLWTDSQVVLGWLSASSSNFVTFVANRVSHIQAISSMSQWRYVPSKENPADVLSRGIEPDKLRECSLWFYGPIFLHGPDRAWPNMPAKLPTNIEQKTVKTTLSVTSEASILLTKVINHRNSFRYLLGVVSFMTRFIKNSRNKQANVRETSPVATAQELDKALTFIIREIQAQEFREEIASLMEKGIVGKTSPIKTLNPFLDQQHILRVGGRLENADISYDAKHPMLLPYNNEITRLLFEEYHWKNAHVGPHALLALVRQRFWPVNGKTIARSVLHNCVRCTVLKPKLLQQTMGNLPTERVQPARPFTNSGVDFCGPFWTHFKIRGKRPLKTYVAIFCCFATKAVHIEVVSDLTTDAFIGALKRFISRRGHCRKLHCDNATNFVGASNQLRELQDTIFSEEAGKKIAQYCSTKSIDFQFIPPKAPHFGGLWEAAVKSAKHLFYRSVLSANLTYEELTTVMTEIEAILNSRPLTPTSSDANDLTALTPAHFLIGEPLISIVDPHASPFKGNLAQRWKLVSHLKTEFWNRWSKEYLSELQHRYKWHQQYNNIPQGLMVLLKDDNLPPLSWPLGRIVNTVQGKDGKVRVADVKTASGLIRRPIHKLAPLPVPVDQETSNEPQQQVTNDEKKQPIMSDTSSPRSKRRKIETPIVHSLLTGLLILPTVLSSNISITPFTNQPGLYFENMGKTFLISDEWNIIVYFNMDDYWREWYTITHGIHNLVTICNSLVQKQPCNDTIAQFDFTIKEIQNANILLQSKTSLRHTRAPLDIIGNLANSLFGVLDSRYAEKMSSIIDSIGSNQQYLHALIKNQTSLTDATVNIIKRSQENFEENIQLINQKFNQTITQLNEVELKIREQELAEIFNELSSKLILAITNYQRMQSSLLGVLIHAHNGKVNPILITPNQVQQQINLIKEHLPSNLQLPTAQDHLLEIYNLLTIEGKVTKDKIIFRLRLPLLTHEVYEMLKITPIPIILNDTLLVIEPQADYLIVNFHRDTYYPLNEQELNKCFAFGNTRHMCKQRHPLYRKGTKVAACEIGILTQMTNLSTCKIIIARQPQRWTQLSAENQWIYSLQEETTINIICNNKLSQKTLSGSGLIQISPGCTISDDATTIQSHNLYQSSVTTSFLPPKNITALLHPITMKTLLHKPIPSLNISRDISLLQTRVNTLQQTESLGIGIKNHQIHHLSISYLGIAIIIGIIVYLGWQRYHKKSTSTPTPPPRNFQLQSQSTTIG